MNIRKLLVIVLVLAVMLLTVSCMPGDGKATEEKPAHFFWGIWHGWIAPFSLIASFFNDNLGIYEIHNKGVQYDIGYYIAVISGFGSVALFRGKKHKND